MGERVYLSGRHPVLPDIAVQHRDLESSLRLYFSPASPDYAIRFAGYTTAEVIDELHQRLDEVDLTSCLLTLTAIEAAFRIDYLQRNYRKDKDPVSRSFRELYRTERDRLSLEDGIFEVWVQEAEGSRSIIGELRGAFKFRHWLAHGRYWTPKFGRRYGYEDIYALADQVLNSFPPSKADR